MRFCLPVNKVPAIRSLRVPLEKAYKVFGVGLDLRLVAVVTVDEHEHAPSADGYFRALVVARRRAHSANGVAVDGQTGDVEHPSADALVRFALAADAECKRIACELVGVETAYAVAVGYACKVD